MKKIPLRKCVITGEILPKKDLIRVVKDNQGNVFVDKSSKANGHGAYIKKDLSVLEKAKKNKTLSKVFACDIKDEIYDELSEFIKKN